MSQHPHYEFRLADSETLDTLAYLKQAKQRRLALVFNKPGAFDGVVLIDSFAALKIKKHSTCIVAERNGEVVWSGPVFSVSDDCGGASDTTSFSSSGWYEELNHRELSKPEADSINSQIVGSFSGGDIAMTILLAIIGRLDSSSSPAPVRVFPSTNDSYDTQLRTRSYQVGQNVGAAITELIDIENGMDIAIDPVSRKFKTYPPAGANQIWVDRKDVHFAYNMKPNNIATIRRIEDGTRTANSLRITGANGISIIVDDPLAIKEQKVLLEETISLGDVNDASIIAAYGNAEIIYRSRGAVSVSMRPKSLSEDVDSMIYRPFDDFNLGDQIYVSCDRGRLQLDRFPMRVFAFTIDVDDNGNETVSEIQATAS